MSRVHPGLVLLVLLLGGCAPQPPAPRATAAVPEPPRLPPKPQAQPEPTAATPKPAERRILIVNAELADDDHGSANSLTKAVQRLGAWPITVRHYSQVTAKSLAELAPTALLLTPQRTPWWRYPQDKLERFEVVMRDVKTPTLGICGGHQLLALCFGGEVAPYAGRPAGNPATYAGLEREKGWIAVHQSGHDDLLAGISEDIPFWLNHCEEVKRLPDGFTVLASGDKTAIMAMRHADRPLYGVQFHPEVEWEQHPVGKRLLVNFLRIAGLLDKAP